MPRPENALPCLSLPDFIVTFVSGECMLVRIKGQTGDAEIKAVAAHRWCNAVNNDGRFGRWSYHNVRQPPDLMKLLDKLVGTAAPLLDFTCWYASQIVRFAMLKGFVDVMSLLPDTRVGDIRQLDNAAPSLHSHYKSFITTTGSSAPCCGIGILPHGYGHLSFPFPSATRFSRSIPKPVLSSCRLYADCHQGRKQVPP